MFNLLTILVDTGTIVSHLAPTTYSKILENERQIVSVACG